MKSIYHIIILLFFLGTGSTINAQIDLMDALKQTAEMHNEANGEDDGSNSAELTPQQEEWQAEWEAEWQHQQDAAFLNSLGNKYLKCTALMVLYVHAYLKLANEYKLGELTMSVCDAYGMQTLAMASSTTIMYCPEEMASLSNQQLQNILHDFLRQFAEHVGIDVSNPNREFTEEEQNIMETGGPGNDLWAKVWRKFWFIRNYALYGQTDNNGNVNVDDYVNIDEHDETDPDGILLKYMIAFFRPEFIISETLKIAQEMEALGCSG